MPSISHDELRASSQTILRRVEAGERFTITMAGRPVTSLSPARRQWVSTSDLGDLWRTSADASLAHDLEAFGGELGDPWDR
jgi:prevent-host-death family protein